MEQQERSPSALSNAVQTTKLNSRLSILVCAKTRSEKMDGNHDADASTDPGATSSSSTPEVDSGREESPPVGLPATPKWFFPMILDWDILVPSEARQSVDARPAAPVITLSRSSEPPVNSGGDGDCQSHDERMSGALGDDAAQSVDAQSAATGGTVYRGSETSVNPDGDGERRLYETSGALGNKEVESVSSELAAAVGTVDAGSGPSVNSGGDGDGSSPEASENIGDNAAQSVGSRRATVVGRVGNVGANGGSEAPAGSGGDGLARSHEVSEDASESRKTPSPLPMDNGATTPTTGAEAELSEIEKAEIAHRRLVDEARKGKRIERFQEPDNHPEGQQTPGPIESSAETLQEGNTAHSTTGSEARGRLDDALRRAFLESPVGAQSEPAESANRSEDYYLEDGSAEDEVLVVDQEGSNLGSSLTEQEKRFNEVRAEIQRKALEMVADPEACKKWVELAKEHQSTQSPAEPTVADLSGQRAAAQSTAPKADAGSFKSMAVEGRSETGSVFEVQSIPDAAPTADNAAKIRARRMVQFLVPRAFLRELLDRDLENNIKATLKAYNEDKNDETISAEDTVAEETLQREPAQPLSPAAGSALRGVSVDEQAEQNAASSSASGVTPGQSQQVQAESDESTAVDTPAEQEQGSSSSSAPKANPGQATVCETRTLWPNRPTMSPPSRQRVKTVDEPGVEHEEPAAAPEDLDVAPEDPEEPAVERPAKRRRKTQGQNSDTPAEEPIESSEEPGIERKESAEEVEEPTVAPEYLFVALKEYTEERPAKRRRVIRAQSSNSRLVPRSNPRRQCRVQEGESSKYRFDLEEPTEEPAAEPEALLGSPEEPSAEKPAKRCRVRAQTSNSPVAPRSNPRWQCRDQAAEGSTLTPSKEPTAMPAEEPALTPEEPPEEKTVKRSRHVTQPETPGIPAEPHSNPRRRGHGCGKEVKSSEY
ncbi:hypothetical protein B0H63DRAFT_443025 [Podospora didyma]|uniref:Uncharacterized protein n=1 Tax=Podospora didyma TaxID=330526 RepID=A0AAE0P3V4_9PEZI|nr:hypothetical protein B0H63DRAFT_443025 [Podospora didyma]